MTFAEWTNTVAGLADVARNCHNQVKLMNDYAMALDDPRYLAALARVEIAETNLRDFVTANPMPVMV